MAIGHHGCVLRVGWRGGLADGGEMDASFLLVTTVQGGRITRIEVFDDDDRGAAVVRLEELRLANAVTRASEGPGPAWEGATGTPSAP